jgi:hypothetical protein
MQLLNPDPMVVATKFLERRTFKDTGKQFNVIAASWIQFMIHDWIDHLEDTDQVRMEFINLKLQEKKSVIISLFFSSSLVVGIPL